MRIFLDDERLPPQDGKGWIIVRSVGDAIKSVEANGFPVFVSFDNDLGERQPEGRCFAAWLLVLDMDSGNMPENFAFYVHSHLKTRRRLSRRSTRIHSPDQPTTQILRQGCRHNQPHCSTSSVESDHPDSMQGGNALGPHGCAACPVEMGAAPPDNPPCPPHTILHPLLGSATVTPMLSGGHA